MAPVPDRAPRSLPERGREPSRSTRRVAAGALAWAPLVACLVAPPASAQLVDPVRVFYPAGVCTDGILEIEVWNRTKSRWEAHPEHPRIVGETCQEEDAGTLLNELRIRCHQSTRSEPSRWRVGVSVWSPDWMQACERPLQLREPAPDLTLRVEAPRASARISNERRVTPVRGAIELGGGRLAAHDVMLILDLSPRIEKARRRFVDELIARLADRSDAIRVGVVTFSSAENSSAKEWVGAEAALSIPLRAELGELPKRVAALEPPRAQGPQAFPDAVSLALAALGGSPLRADRRAALGHLIGFVDGGPELPFGGGARMDPIFRRRLLDAVTVEAEAQISIHLLALAEELPTPPVASTLTRRAGARFAAVPDSAGAIALLPKLVPPRLESVQVNNLSMGVGGASIRFEADGTFSAELPLAEGMNLFSVVAQLEDGRVIREEREVVFDSSAVRDAWRRRELERRGTQVEVDVEEP